MQKKKKKRNLCRVLRHLNGQSAQYSSCLLLLLIYYTQLFFLFFKEITKLSWRKMKPNSTRGHKKNSSKRGSTSSNQYVVDQSKKFDNQLPHMVLIMLLNLTRRMSRRSCPTKDLLSSDNSDMKQRKSEN